MDINSGKEEMNRLHRDRPTILENTKIYKICTCESEKDPWFSRVEPMGYYCRDCGGLVE